jgi:hypothetical protein
LYTDIDWNDYILGFLDAKGIFGEEANECMLLASCSVEWWPWRHHKPGRSGALMDMIGAYDGNGACKMVRNVRLRQFVASREHHELKLDKAIFQVEADIVCNLDILLYQSDKHFDDSEDELTDAIMARALQRLRAAVMTFTSDTLKDRKAELKIIAEDIKEDKA